MLILSRTLGEVVLIGTNIRVKVLGLKGHQVRLGIDAPAEVGIHREEVYQRIKQEQTANEERGNEDREEETHNRDRSD